VATPSSGLLHCQVPHVRGKTIACLVQRSRVYRAGEGRMRLATIRILQVLALAGALVIVNGCQHDDQDTPTEGELGGDGLRLGLVTQELQSPVRLVAARGGELLVSDSRLGMIFTLNPLTLEPERGFVVGGKALALGVSGDQILVGNASRRTIEVYGDDGTLEGSYGPGAVDYPLDLAIDDGLGLVFVVDGIAREVKVFDSRGVLQTTFTGRLVSPMGIAVDTVRGEVLVSDWGDFGRSGGGSASIKIFSYDGTFIDEISGAGDCGMTGCSGGFSRPHGLDVDGRSRIYVADALLAQVLIFDRSTKQQVGIVGNRPALRVPTDVVLAEGGDLFVTSNRTASVALFLGGSGE